MTEDLMISAATAAAATIPLILPYLGEAAKAAAKKVGEKGAEGGLHLLDRLRQQLTGRAAEALADLEQTPASADNQADLRKQLTEYLKQDPTFLADVQALLNMAQSQASAATSQTQNVGPGGKAAQIVGTGNTTTIG